MVWLNEAVAHCQAQWEAGCGLLREGMQASTATAFAAMAEEVWRSAPWRFSRVSQWLRLDGLDPSPMFISLRGQESESPALCIVLAPLGGASTAMDVARAEESAEGREVLHVFYPGAPPVGLEAVPPGGAMATRGHRGARSIRAGLEAVPPGGAMVRLTSASAPAAVALNAGRTGPDALATREELLICINVLRMLSLVPLAEGKPFTKRFVNRQGSEARVTWPHPYPVEEE